MLNTREIMVALADSGVALNASEVLALTDSFKAAGEAALGRRNVIVAVKAVRAYTGCNLTEAKTALDTLQSEVNKVERVGANPFE